MCIVNQDPLFSAMSDNESAEEPGSKAGPAGKSSDDETDTEASGSKAAPGSHSNIDTSGSEDDDAQSSKPKSLIGESVGEDSDEYIPPSSDDEVDTDTESERDVSSAEQTRIQRERVESLRASETRGEGGESTIPERFKIKPDPFIDEIREKYLGRKSLEPPQIGPLLASQLIEEDIDSFFKAFKGSKDGYMDEESFKSILLATGRISLTAEEFNTLFLRMDTNNDKKVGWDEFLSFIMFEAQEQEMSREYVDLDVPLSGFPRVIKSRHHFPIIRTTFMPVMEPDRTVTLLKGRYITASRDGLIRYWTLDLEPEGSAWAKSITLRKNSSWVTDVVSMPDLHVLCVTSTERDIRFYDVKAVRFDLRVMITRLPESVTCMHYHFPKEADRNSLLITGDVGGSVRIYCFCTEDINPFYCTEGSMLKIIPYFKVLKGGMRNATVLEYLQVHNDWVKQVSYSSRVRSFISCATTDENSLIMWGLHRDDKPQRYHAHSGITCFSLCEDSHLMATGCMNGLVLVWDAWLPGKSTAEFQGHKGPIVLVVFQQEGRRVYSMSKDRCIKVWDVPKHMCIQTYNGMPSGNALSGLSPSYYYNSVSRTLVVASHKMCVLLLGPALDTSRSDGYTHTMPVVRALYNPLYKSVATVGMDSYIMIWNIWEGRRMVFIKEAHTRNYYGVPVPVEITSATLDPSYQNLVTGARDGSIKVWDFNMGICVRQLNIDLFCEVTSIVWVPGRILAVGWDRHVTEFYEESYEDTGKVWETRHTDDILCMAYRIGQSVATSSYNGELVLWRLETGQAYKRFNVGSPGTKIILTYTSKTMRKSSTSVLQAGTPYAITIHQKEYDSPYAFHKTSLYTGVHPFITSNVKAEQVDLIVGDRGTLRRASSSAIGIQRHGSRVWPSQMVGGGLLSSASISSARRASQAALEAIGRRRSSLSQTARSSPSEEEPPPSRRARRVSYVNVPVATKPTAATAVLFLQTRPMEPNTGSLLVATDKGIIQMWSHHALGHCLGGFLAIHMAGDYVTCMDTDDENDYLFTGTSQGFIKVWLMKNYAYPECEKVRICMPLLRLLFPFLWHDRIEGRAKRSLRGQKLPLLLNSYRGHLMAITCIQIVKDYDAIMTASSDSSVRLWGLSGRYLGTLGGARAWDTFKENYGKKFVEYRPEEDYMIPPDVKQVMSSTTLKVLVEGNLSRAGERSKEDQLLVGTMPDKVRAKATHGRRVGVPVLGNYITVPEDEPTEPPPELVHDKGDRKVCVYHLLRTQEMEEVEQPTMPETLLYQKRIMQKKWMERAMASRFAPKRSLPRIDFGSQAVDRVAEWMARQSMVDTHRRSTLMNATKAWEQRRRTTRPVLGVSFVSEARAVAKSLRVSKVEDLGPISLTGPKTRRRKTQSLKDAVRFDIKKMRDRSSTLSRGPPRPRTPTEMIATPLAAMRPTSESRPSTLMPSGSLSDRGSLSSYKGLATKLSLAELRAELADWLMEKMQGNQDRSSIMKITDELSGWLVEAGTKTDSTDERYSIMSLRGRVANRGADRPSVDSMKGHIAEWLLGPASKGTSEEELQLWRRLNRLAAARKDRGDEKPHAGPELTLQQRIKALQREEAEKEAAKRREMLEEEWRKRHSSFDSVGEPPSSLHSAEGEGRESARSSRMADHWPFETHPSKILIHRGRYPGKGPVRLQWSYGRPAWEEKRTFKAQLETQLLDRALPYSKSRAKLPTAKQIKRKQVREDMRRFVMGAVNCEIDMRAGLKDEDGKKEKKDKKGKKKDKKGKKK